MTTKKDVSRSFTIKFTVSAEMIAWVAEKLKCNRKNAFKAIREAYERTVDAPMCQKSLIFEDSTEARGIVLADAEQACQHNENNIWPGKL